MAARGGPNGHVSALRATLMEEEQRRNELYGGQGTNGAASRPPDEQSMDQIVNTAVTTHKETTQVATNALKIVEQTKKIQEATMVELVDQRERLEKVNDDMYKLHENIGYSEKLLRYMRRCCCCWMCDCCTGADPEERMKAKWERRVDKGKNDLDAEYVHARGVNQVARVKAGGPPQKGVGPGGKGPQQAGGAGGSQLKLRDPDIRLPEQYRNTEMGLHEQTRKQNDIINQIGDGLDALLAGAQETKKELAVQDELLNAVEAKAGNVQGRIKEMNTKSQLRNYKGK